MLKEETMCPTKGEKPRAGDTAVGSNSRHILLLDDEPAVRDALSRVLKSHGYLCSAAATGETLLNILEGGLQSGISYDLAILDIKIIGGMAGIETMQKIKQFDSRLPALSMSGYPPETLFDGSESSGFVGHLEKPFKGVELVAEIERVCSTPSPTELPDQSS